MIIVKIYAGLANQMFQYALYKALLAADKDAYTDTASFFPKWDFEKVGLADVFPNIQLHQADAEFVARLNDSSTDLLSKARRKLNIYKGSFIREPKFTYNDFVFHLQRPSYLKGFWQTEKYFKNIEGQIRNDFAFPAFEDDRNKQIVEKMQNTNSVSVHIRKGADYKKKSTIDTCGIDYYRKAIEYIRKHVEEPKFYVFSDNHQWVRENLTGFKFESIDWNPTAGLQNYLDMQLMSSCKHNVIANSSYSWWGAWLNTNNKKVVVGPEKWFSQGGPDFDSSDLIPESWVKL